MVSVLGDGICADEPSHTHPLAMDLWVGKLSGLIGFSVRVSLSDRMLDIIYVSQ